VQPKLDREAGWREVLEQVSVVDVGSQTKSLLIGAIVWGVFFALIVAIEAGLSAADLGFHVPTTAWIALFVFIFVMGVTMDRSYHEWTFRFFFPKLGLIGWLVATAYLTLIIESLRLVKDLAGLFERGVAFFAVYLVLMAPGVLLLGLLELGHNRLMDKRAAIAEKRS